MHAHPHTFFCWTMIVERKKWGSWWASLATLQRWYLSAPEVWSCWFHFMLVIFYTRNKCPTKGCHYVPMSPKKMNASGYHTRFWTWWSLLVGSVWNKGVQYFQFSPPRRQHQADKSCPSCVIAYLIHLCMGFSIWHTMGRVQSSQVSLWGGLGMTMTITRR